MTRAKYSDTHSEKSQCIVTYLLHHIPAELRRSAVRSRHAFCFKWIIFWRYQITEEGAMGLRVHWASTKQRCCKGRRCVHAARCKPAPGGRRAKGMPVRAHSDSEATQAVSPQAGKPRQHNHGSATRPSASSSDSVSKNSFHCLSSSRDKLLVFLIVLCFMLKIFMY